MMMFERDGEGASYSFLAPRNAEQLVLKRRNIEFWSQATFGQMGRFPEFIAELVVVCWIGRTSSKSTTKQWAENARDYHRYVSSNDLCLTHALTDQYYNRTKRASEQEDPDLILHIVGETTAGRWCEACELSPRKRRFRRSIRIGRANRRKSIMRSLLRFR
jgi:aromatic ring hydroxylase